MRVAKTDAGWWREYFTPLYREVYQGPLFNQSSTETEGRFLVSAFQDCGPGMVLDLGCGHGRHAGILRKAKLNVVGADRFEHLLLAHPKRTRKVACADMRELPFANASLAGAYCIFNTFGYFDHGQNMRVLAELGRTLRPGGLLILQVPNRPVMARIAREIPPSQMMGPRFSIVEHYDYDREERSLIGGGVWMYKDKQQTWQFRLRLYTIGELTRALARYGLEVRQTFEDFEKNPFDPKTSAEIVLLARKRT